MVPPPGAIAGAGDLASPGRVEDPQEAGVTGDGEVTVGEDGPAGEDGLAGVAGVLARPARVYHLDLHGLLIHGVPVTSLSPSLSLHLVTPLVGKMMVGITTST